MSIIILLITIILVIAALALMEKRPPVFHAKDFVNREIFPEIRVDLGPCGQSVQTGWADWSGGTIKTFNTPFGSFTATLNSGNAWLDNGELVELDPDSNPHLIKTAKTELFRDGYTTDSENIILTLKGLDAGTYTVTLYSCNTAKGATGFWADFKVGLTDENHKNSIIVKDQHTYAIDAYQRAAVTPFSFTTNGTDPVVITMARTRGELWLNGFVITPINLDDLSFTHPMTVINREELAIVQELIAKNIQPQADAYQKLIVDADEALQFLPDPPVNMNIMSSYELGTTLQEMRTWLWKNCHAAYSSALAYIYSEKPKYAAKAVEILNTWAKKNTTFSGAERGLQLGSFFTPMLYAADLLYDYQGWDSDDRKVFQEWWRKNCLIHTREIMYSRDNDWKDAGLLGVFAGAVVLEDPTLLYEALVELTSYSYGDWKLKRTGDGVFLPREVYRNSGRNGITYTNFTFACLVQALEIARYAGFNLWNLKTTGNATLKEAIESLFKWDVLGHPFPWNPNPSRKDIRKNTFEIANNHFELIPEILSWLKKNRPVSGAQGDEYTTLNKGDIPPISANKVNQ